MTIAAQFCYNYHGIITKEKSVYAERGLLMFHPGELVCYGPQGVCRITEIRERSCGGPVQPYYILQPLGEPQSVVCVPTGQEALVSRMRPVLSADRVRALIRSLPQLEPLWIENETARRDALRQLLKTGTAEELACAVKGLYLRRQALRTRGRRLHSADEAALREAEHLLYGEIACALQLPPDQVLSFIRGELGELTESD